MVSSEIQSLLDTYKTLKYDELRNKVVCQLTKHEMPTSVAAIQSYVSGKKFKKASGKAIDLDQYKPHIVISNKRKHLHELFCHLTLRHVAQTRQAVERHVSGKKYKRALARWTKCQETGEKFVPRGGRRKRMEASDNDSIGSGAHNWSDDSANEDNTDDDDLEDLYPAEVFGRDSDDDDEDDESNEDEATEALEETPQLSKHSKKGPGMINDADQDSDYDMSVMDRGVDGTGNNGDTEKATDSQVKKRGKKKKKKASEANGETAISKSTGKRKERKAESAAKPVKRKNSVDAQGPKLKKKKKLKSDD